MCLVLLWDLYNNQIGDKGMESFIDIFVHNTTITNIYYDTNNIDKEINDQISEGLERNKKIMAGEHVTGSLTKSARK